MSRSVHDAQIRISAKDQASQVIRGVDKQMNGLSDTVGKFMGLFAAGFTVGKVFDFFGKSVKAAAESERAWLDVTEALKRHGYEVEQNTRAIQDFANSYQSLTGIDDETVGKATQTFIDFGNSVTESMNYVKVAMDLAAGANMDFASAVDLIAKASVGYTATLSRYGIIISEQIPQTEKFAAALEQINQRFGGAALARVDATETKLTILNQTYGDLTESIGRLFTKSGSLSGALDITTDAVRGLGKAFDILSGEAFKTEIGLEGTTEQVTSLSRALGEMLREFAGGDDAVKNASVNWAQLGSIMVFPLIQLQKFNVAVTKLVAGGKGREEVLTGLAAAMKDFAQGFNQGAAAVNTVDTKEIDEVAESFAKLIGPLSSRAGADAVAANIAAITTSLQDIAAPRTDDYVPRLQEIELANAGTAGAVSDSWERAYAEVANASNTGYQSMIDAANLASASFDSFTNGVVDAVFGMKISLKNIFKSIAADWIKYFIQEALGGIKAKFVKGVLKILGGLFDNPVNDHMIMREGSRAAMFFNRGWDQTMNLTNPAGMAIARVSPLRSSEMPQARRGGDTINNYYQGVTPDDFIDRDVIPKVSIASKLRRTKITPNTDERFGGSIVFGGAV